MKVKFQPNFNFQVFFIKSGEVAFVITECGNKVIESIYQGEYFGEVDLLFYNEVRKYTAQAMKECEFYVLNKKDFREVFIQEFRDIGEEIYSLAKNRKISMKELYRLRLKEAAEEGKAKQVNLFC